MKAISLSSQWDKYQSLHAHLSILCSLMCRSCSCDQFVLRGLQAYHHFSLVSQEALFFNSGVKLYFTSSVKLHRHIWLWRPETSEPGCGCTSTFRQDTLRKHWINSRTSRVCSADTRKHTTKALYTLTQATQTWNPLPGGGYSHVCHDFVQEDAVHQLHEHVDPLLGAHLITWPQRAQRPHLQTEGEVNYSESKNSHWALWAFFSFNSVN